MHVLPSLTIALIHRCGVQQPAFVSYYHHSELKLLAIFCLALLYRILESRIVLFFGLMRVAAMLSCFLDWHGIRWTLLKLR